MLKEFSRLRAKARKLATAESDRLLFARGFVVAVMNAFGADTSSSPVKASENHLAVEIGRLSAKADDEMAAYLISTVYTAMLPEAYRSQYGVFFTPPGLTRRLLDQAEAGGVDWAHARVLDPSCGGGAFLGPVALRMRKALSGLSPEERVTHIENHLHGYEIDAFTAWMTQTFVELVLKDDLSLLDRPLEQLVTIRDSLKTPESEYGQADLVVGNPPYGKVTLAKEVREHWRRSLHGHANLYGLFTDLAVRLAASGGIIAYVTPTSFLGGQYFQALRQLMASEAPPYAADFIDSREGVFEDVLQEAMLTCYQKDGTGNKLKTAYLKLTEKGGVEVSENGSYRLPKDSSGPWILPRTIEAANIAEAIQTMPYRLSDYGYRVSTGPLVWNRHKPKLLPAPVDGAVPLIWAECVDPMGSGVFTFRNSRRHSPWFLPGDRDTANLIKKSSVLLQRTTAIEQRRRLIAAELPQEFIDEHGGTVSVENHLNMVRPLEGKSPKISPRALARLFNSRIVDDAFRCISGSTAVSAYELHALPLPDPTALSDLERLIEEKADDDMIERFIEEQYKRVNTSAAA